MPKTYEEINDKIRQGSVVVVTAEEMVDIVAEEGAAKAAEHVDVVTTGTFSPMCSSGAILNIGHTRPRMKIARAWLNGVPAYAGLAAVDLYLGASEVVENDPLNRAHPGEFRYGGGHVIQELIAGDDVVLRAEGYGTDCYPRRELETLINIEDLNEAILCDPRNGYQNYNVAVNTRTDRDVYTYLGVVKADLGSANYSSAGQLSPLLNDPHYRTVGIGTRIWLGGAQGYVFWHGTQHDPSVPRAPNGVPRGGAGTLACVGDMTRMDPRWVVGVSLQGYGVSLCVGIGIPIPILDEDMARFTAVSDADIVAPLVDYGHDYPELTGEPLGYVSYADLRSGEIQLRGKGVPTASLSSYPRAREIATLLKDQVEAGEFLLSRPAELLPSAESGKAFRPLRERPPVREVR